MLEKSKNILIGFFFIATCVVLASLLLFLHPSYGDGKQIIRVRFCNIDKINVGTRVTFAGRPIGEVIGIEEIYQARSQPNNGSGDLYFYELVLQIDSKTNIYNSDEIVIKTSGLLGERSIAIIPKPPTTKEPLQKIKPDETLYATAPASIEDTIANFTHAADELDKLLSKANRLVDENYHQISGILNGLNSALKELSSTLTTVNKEGFVSHFTETLSTMNQLLTDLWTELQTLKQEKTTLKLAQTIDHFQKITQALDNPQKWESILDYTFNLTQLLGNFNVQEINSKATLPNILNNLYGFSIHCNAISTEIESGKGTLGKLVYDPSLYLKAMGLLNRGNIVLNDINQYGLLFHSNRAWQSERAKRMVKLHNVKTPEQLQTFMQDELDRINTSMSRVIHAVQQAESYDKAELKEDLDVKVELKWLIDQMRDLENMLHEFSDSYTQE